MGEVLIPPWVRPESPETIRWIDDATMAFAGAFGRGMTQRGIWADPRWGLRRRYRGLRSDQKAAILNSLSETRGQLNILRITPHAPIRGSFPATQMISNNSFESGTTGWSSSSGTSLAVSDRMLRATRTAVTATQLAAQPSSAITGLTQYAPYAARYFIRQGRGTYPTGFSIFESNLNDRISAITTSYGMITGMRVPSGDTMNPGLQDESASGVVAGDYVSVQYASLARCLLVDNETNVMLYSDALDNTGAWGATNSNGLASVSGTATAPDGTATAQRLVENSSNSTHFRAQTVTVSSSATDVMFGVALKSSGRAVPALQLVENTGSTAAAAWFNIGTGAVGTISAPGANWSGVRTYIVPLGDSWYACYIVARKTNAATSVTARIYLSSTDSVVTYTGDGTSGAYAWRATLTASAVPARLVQTTSAAVINNAQSGAGLYVKGGVASTSGLLLTGDWIEWSGELKQLTAPLNTDAAGLGYLQFRPSLAGTPAYNDPIIVAEPFGRFMYPQGARELENLFGIYGDCEMNLEEIYS
jgi:hypothetical protein